MKKIETNWLIIIVVGLCVVLFALYSFKNPSASVPIAPPTQSIPAPTPQPPPDLPAPIPPPSGPELPPPADPEIVWMDYDAAFKLSAATKKPVFVLFVQPNCPACAELEKTLLHPQVKEELKKCIPTGVDVSKNPRMARKYRVAVTPSYFIVDHKGRVLKQSYGFKDPAQIMEWLGQNRTDIITIRRR